MRIARNLPQRLQIAIVFRQVDRRRQFAVSLLSSGLWRLADKAVGVIQIDQFFPELLPLGFIVGGKRLFRLHRLRRFLSVGLILCLGPLLFLIDSGSFLRSRSRSFA